MLNHLPRIVTRRKKRRGQGPGSGKGFHTTGRGAKGANVRKTTKILFMGTKRKKALIKRLPLRRGKR
jgi:ribosomal protein L15